MAAPSAARASAVARPTPLPAPVTRATCPSSRVIHYPPVLTVALVLRSHIGPIDVPAQDAVANDRSGRQLYPQSTAPSTAVMAHATSGTMCSMSIGIPTTMGLRRYAQRCPSRSTPVIVPFDLRLQVRARTQETSS